MQKVVREEKIYSAYMVLTQEVRNVHMSRENVTKKRLVNGWKIDSVLSCSGGGGSGDKAGGLSTPTSTRYWRDRRLLPKFPSPRLLIPGPGFLGRKDTAVPRSLFSLRVGWRRQRLIIHTVMIGSI